MPPLRGLLAYPAVAVLGTCGMFAIPTVLDLRNGDAQAVMAVIGLATIAGMVAVGRRMLGPPYLRKQAIVVVAVAPVAVAAIIAAVLYGLELAGADCPRSGMDYIDECNDPAGASMMIFFTGIYVVGLMFVAAFAVAIAAVLVRFRRPRASLAEAQRS